MYTINGKAVVAKDDILLYYKEYNAEELALCMDEMIDDIHRAKTEEEREYWNLRYDALEERWALLEEVSAIEKERRAPRR